MKSMIKVGVKDGHKEEGVTFSVCVVLFNSELLEVSNNLCYLKMNQAALKVMSSPSLMVFTWTALVKRDFSGVFLKGIPSSDSRWAK